MLPKPTMAQRDDIWADVERIVSQEELRRALAELERAGAGPTGGSGGTALLERSGPYLTALFGAILGAWAGTMTVMFNFLLFVWILHVSF